MDWRKHARSVAAALQLTPVVVAWYDLFRVFDSYADLETEPRPALFEAWSAGDLSGPSLPSLAFHILLSIVFVMAVMYLLDVTEPDADEAESTEDVPEESNAEPIPKMALTSLGEIARHVELLVDQVGDLRYEVRRFNDANDDSGESARNDDIDLRQAHRQSDDNPPGVSW